MAVYYFVYAIAVLLLWAKSPPQTEHNTRAHNRGESLDIHIMYPIQLPYAHCPGQDLKIQISLAS